MIVDRRAGSRDLFPQLRAAGLRDVELGEMAYGDISITGRGPEGCPWMIGVEYKKLSDLAQCIDNGRLVGHQIPGMLACYNDVWILVEGIWREGASGLVEVPRGGGWSPMIAGRSGLMSNALHGFLFTLQVKLGVKVWPTGTPSQTVRWLLALNRWWTSKEYDEHKAHLAFDNSQALALISKPSLLRRVAKELPGIGWDRSGRVARHFSSVADMAMADQEEWEEIEGIGEGIAKRVVKEIRGER